MTDDELELLLGGSAAHRVERLAARERSDFSAAAEHARRALELAQRAAAMDTASRTLRCLVLARNGVAEEDLHCHDPSTAVPLLRANLDTLDDALLRHPDDLALRWELVGVHDRLAEAAVLSNDVVGQLEHLEIARDIALGVVRDATSADLSMEAPSRSEAERTAAIVLTKLGRLSAEAEDRPSAVRSFQESIDLLDRCRAREPEDQTTSRALLRALRELGDVRHATGDRAGAGRAYERAFRIAVALPSSRPGDQADLAHLGERLGDLAAAQGDRSAASDFYTAGLTAVSTSEQPGASRRRGVLHGRLSSVLDSSGDQEGARHHASAALEVAETLLSTAGLDPLLADDVAQARLRLAALEQPGDPAAAFDHLRVAVEVAEQGVGAGAGDDLIFNLASYRTQLAEVAAEQAEIPTAVEQLTKAVDELGAVGGLSDGDVRLDRCQVRLQLAWLLLGAGDPSAAVGNFDVVALDAGASAGDRAAQMRFGALLGAGQAHASLGDHTMAVTRLSEARVAAESLAAHSRAPESLLRICDCDHELGQLARRSGDVASARAHFGSALATTERLIELAPGDDRFASNAAYFRSLIAEHGPVG